MRYSSSRSGPTGRPVGPEACRWAARRPARPGRAASCRRRAARVWSCESTLQTVTTAVGKVCNAGRIAGHAAVMADRHRHRHRRRCPRGTAAHRPVGRWPRRCSAPTRPGCPVARLVRAGALFGLAEGTVRTALSRMAAAGEVTRSGDGWYALAGALVERQARQRAGRAAATVEWSGRWRQAVVGAGGRPAAERADLRRAMERLRMARAARRRVAAPRQPGPGPLARRPAVVDAQCRWFHVAPRRRRRAWPASAVGPAGVGRAVPPTLRRGMGWLVGRLERGRRRRPWRPGFVLSAAVLRHFMADPLLPRELWPRRWPGGRAAGRLRPLRHRVPRPSCPDWFANEPAQAGRRPLTVGPGPPLAWTPVTDHPTRCRRPRPRAPSTTASTSASCSPGATSPTTDQVARQMVNFSYLIGDRETGECMVVDPAYGVARAGRRRRPRTACA